MWMIRNSGGQFADEFIEKGLVSVGWDETGPLNELKTREQVIARVNAVWPEYKKMKAITSGSQLDKIVNVIKPKDRVITYDPSKRLYHVGYIDGEYHMSPMPKKALISDLSCGKIAFRVIDYHFQQRIL